MYGILLVVAAYLDNVIIMAESEKDLKRATRKLIGWRIGLMTTNKRKTKYIIVTRHNRQTRQFELYNYNFERVVNFKYLGVDINKNVDSYEEIKLVAANKRYFGLIPIFKLKLLSRGTKNTLYKVLVRFIAL